jgi:hypothetical protein
MDAVGEESVRKVGRKIDLRQRLTMCIGTSF